MAAAEAWGRGRCLAEHERALRQLCRTALAIVRARPDGDAVLAIASRVVEHLERRGFDCAIGGALAMSYWSVPRATLDIDLAVHDLVNALVDLGAEIDVDRALASAIRGNFGARI